jgi:hypothetical protein
MKDGIEEAQLDDQWEITETKELAVVHNARHFDNDEIPGRTNDGSWSDGAG